MTTIDQGGLFRCCVETATKLAAQDHTEGEIIQCGTNPSPDHRLILRNDTWKWYIPDENDMFFDPDDVHGYGDRDVDFLRDEAEYLT